MSVAKFFSSCVEMMSRYSTIVEEYRGNNFSDMLKHKESIQVRQDCGGWFLPAAWLSWPCHGSTSCLLKVFHGFKQASLDVDNTLCWQPKREAKCYEIKMIAETLLTFFWYPRLSEEEFLRIAEVNVAAINAATEGLPQDKVPIPPLWLSWSSPVNHGYHHLCYLNDKMWSG